MDQAAAQSTEYKLHTSLPRVVGYAALALAAVAVVVAVISIATRKQLAVSSFDDLRSRLSKDVIAEVSGYERLESEAGLPKFLIRASSSRTFADQHQEFDDLNVLIYDSAGQPADTISAKSGIYLPGENRNFTVYLKDDVFIETRDGLRVRTAEGRYDRATELAESDVRVEFERQNVRGSSFGARILIGEKRLELLRDVDIEAFDSDEMAKANVKYAHFRGSSATFLQPEGRIDLNDDVVIDIDSKDRSSTIRSDRATAFMEGETPETRSIRSVEVAGNARIVSRSGATATSLEAQSVKYLRPEDRFELHGGVHIVAGSSSDAADIRSNEAIYDRRAATIDLSGNAVVSRATDEVRGDAISTQLTPAGVLRKADVNGGGYLKRVSPERQIEVRAASMSADYGPDGQLSRAVTSGSPRAVLTPSDATSYSLVTFTAARGIELGYRPGGILRDMRTDGRTTIKLDVPNDKPDAANKRVTADTVVTQFSQDGNEIIRAEAAGNAELFIEPKRKAPENYYTTVTAPRFVCDFFQGTNDARTCNAATRTRTVRKPTDASTDRSDQTMSADRLTVDFDQNTRDIARLVATGSVKLNEADRNATAKEAMFTQSDRVARLRGEPLFWDARSRAKAAEIDWDLATERSTLRGSVSTTFYNARQMSGAAPFGDSEKPVFVTSERAELDQRADVGVYIGNARGWQGDNYVRADRLTVRAREGKLYAEGSVQSQLYEAKVVRGGKESTDTVFAAARTMSYDRDSRLLQYRDAVDIRQGTDRITTDAADIYLNEKNEMTRTVAEGSVVITQPGRRATGKSAEYSSKDEIAILRGDPAVVTDSENGGSQASQITVYLRDNRYIGESRPRPNASGRIRTVYKIKNAP
ncbi:MAG: LPS export ABC transporter periplasmic protein LptC [Acidobacteria bacterium]|nr:LPS export ABC transporter periplasmic protein LptC [Acidobacteriota bacterium]MCW5950577.1 LPS export ABC transporter periplasmic protein LptC [Pyrinomonadaceae bacterium]